MLSSHRLYFYHLLSLFLPETSCFGLKNSLLRWCGVRIGSHVRICSSARIMGAGSLTIGDDTWIGQDVLILATGKLTIGSRVDIGPLVYIGNGTHQLDFEGKRCAGTGICPDISIGDGCWLGARVSVLPGVTIGPMSMMASGAVVTKSLPSRCLATGVPAIVKRMY